MVAVITGIKSWDVEDVTLWQLFEQNYFRVLGDVFLCLLSPIVLYRAVATDAKDVSLRTQIMRLTVFVIQYANLEPRKDEYNAYLGAWVILSTLCVVLVLAYKHRNSSLRAGTELLLRNQVFPCAVIALVLNIWYARSTLDLLVYFSLYLDLVSSLPQLRILFDSPSPIGWNWICYLAVDFLYATLYSMSDSYIRPSELRWDGNGTTHIIGQMDALFILAFLWMRVTKQNPFAELTASSEEVLPTSAPTPKPDTEKDDDAISKNLPCEDEEKLPV